MMVIGIVADREEKRSVLLRQQLNHIDIENLGNLAQLVEIDTAFPAFYFRIPVNRHFQFFRHLFLRPLIDFP